VVIFSDYAKGVLEHIPQLLELANKHGIKSFVDPKGTDFSRYQGATFTKFADHYPCRHIR
jgi:D-beta-D-heptose 7-phosphate kinase/D-beta-D-heptose 1-phosphate adenosyltransferase